MTRLPAVASTTPLAHDGRSGARLERVQLEDGRRLILKRTTPQTDLTVAAAGGVDRQRLLWESGVLDRLPHGVNHAIVDIFDDGGETVTVMHDLTDAVVGWTLVLSHGHCRRVVDALCALHRAFVEYPPPTCSSLETRLALLSPQVIGQFAADSNPLPQAVIRGWQRFAELVDEPVATSVFAAHEAPGRLANALSATSPTTLLHGDVWPPNIALLPEGVVLLDWALATAGPAALDIANLLTGTAAHMAPSREELIADFRASSPETDDRTMQLALFAGIVDMGWNKALDAADHANPATRERAGEDLRWWVTQAHHALELF